jgi:glycosyltransferase involved in cell wall biosynthesis
MKLSVIIPCLNAEETIGEQLEALSAQKWCEPWEVLISDNGSTDRSVEVALEFKNRFHAFRVVDASAKRGASFARNCGARAASGEFLAICDADDEVEAGWVAAIGDALEKYEIVCGKMCFDKFNEPGKAEAKAEQWKNGLYKGRFLPGGGGGNFGIRAWVHEKIGGFDETLLHGQDADYFWRLQLAGFTLQYVPEARIQIRIGRVNPTFLSMYRKGRNRSVGNVLCFKRYRNLGMLPPESLGESLRSWVRALRSGVSFKMADRHARNARVLKIAFETGELVGQMLGRATSPCPLDRLAESKAGMVSGKERNR